MNTLSLAGEMIKDHEKSNDGHVARIWLVCSHQWIFFKDKLKLHFPVQHIVQSLCMTQHNKNDMLFLAGEHPGWTEHVSQCFYWIPSFVMSFV